MWKLVLKPVCTTSFLHTGCPHVSQCRQRFGPKQCGLCRWAGDQLGCFFQTWVPLPLLWCSCLQDAEWGCSGRSHVAFTWPTATPRNHRGLNRETQKPRGALRAHVPERLSADNDVQPLPQEPGVNTGGRCFRSPPAPASAGRLPAPQPEGSWCSGPGLSLLLPVEYWLFLYIYF